MSYNIFDKQKDSQINWVGDIPSHWLTSKIKNNFTFSKSTNTSKNPTILSLTLQGIKIRDITTNEGQIASSYDNYTKVYKNDIVMNPMDLISGFVDCSPVEGVISPAYYTLKPNKDIDPEYYKYYLQKHYYEKIFFPFAEGVSVDHRWTLKKEDFLNFSIIKPPLEEQKQIANYLDKKTSKIDTTIAKNKELITLLEEKRTALINQVVTKGLNPEVPMKDSGIEWIGEIPEHWVINRLKFLITKNAQYGANCEPEADEDKFDYRYVRITDIDDNSTLKDNIVFLSKDNAKGFILNEGDVLFARSGATVGKTYLYDKNDGECCFAGYLIRYVTNKHLLNPKYLLYFSFSKSYIEWIKIVSTQATIQNVSADKYDNLIISLPEIKEQNTIVNYLDKETSKINKTITKIKENISLLEEYKTSLIHHVVTGKIDVRGEEI